MRKPKMVTIGGSAGAVRVVQEFLAALPKEPLNAAFTVVMHISRSLSVNYRLIYGERHAGLTEEIKDKMPFEPGNFYFAPADYHVLIEKNGTYSLTQDELVNFARPSIDVTFESVASVFGERACGVLLTGSNGDGALGLREISIAGGMTFVQDPRTCDYPTMAQAALDLFVPSAVLSITDIAARVASWVRES